MNSLASRKKLLVAESELNRAQLLADALVLKSGLRRAKLRVKSLGSLVSSGVILVAGLAALRKGKPAEPAQKTGWLHRLFQGATLLSTLWTAFGTHQREQRTTK